MVTSNQPISSLMNIMLAVSKGNVNCHVLSQVLYYPVENHDKNCDIKPASSGAVPGNGLQSAGSMVKAPGKESM